MSRFAPSLPTLTSARFFAAGWVIVYHINLLAPGHFGSFTEFASIGFLGVPFFFVLSGFILAHTYGQQAVNQSLDKKRFWVARFARVYPLYFIALIFGTIQQIFARDPATPATLIQYPLASILANILLIQNWDPLLFRSINGPGWSVACEAGFYLVFPFICGPLLRLKSTTLIPVLLLNLLVGLLLQNVGGNIALHHYTDIHSESQWSSTVLAVGYMYNPIARLSDFLLGILTYRVASIFSARIFLAINLTAVVFLYVCSRLLLRLATNSNLDYGRHLYSPDPLQTVFVLVAATLIGLLAISGGTKPAWLANSTLVYGGKISYSLYLIHMPILYIALRLVGPTWSRSGILLLLLVFLFSLAVLSFRFVEEPARRSILALRKPR